MIAALPIPRIAALGVLVLWCGLPLLAGRAHAQTRDEQKCIRALNKDFRKLGSRIGKEFLSCVRDFSGNELAGGLATECFASDRNGRIARGRLKTERDFLRRCTDAFPAFGATDPNTVNAW